MTTINEAEAREAVLARNAAYDGRFLFGVVTTGIFCRPSCTSRQAKPENLRFFDNAGSAVSAGFRACKRCKPERQQSQNKMVDVARYIEAHSDEKITLSMLSDRFELSSAHLQKAFSATFGLSPKAFQNGIRQQQFKSLLRDADSVTDALYAAGYGSTSRVYDNSNDQLGMTPGAYRKGAEGETIYYVSGKTQLGLLMLAATEQGVCFAMFGDTENELEELLKAEFPDAAINRASDHAHIDMWFQQIEQYLLADQPLPDIPVDLRGTAFQLRVWQFLQTIASGDVVSYSDVAIGIDKPSAVRAAASACAKNRVAILVPCHRVLRGDGGIGGYRWGVDTKRDLLALEKS